MKITIPRTFDTKFIPDENVRKSLQNFTDWLNGFTDTMVRLATNQVSFQDNINCKLISDNFQNGVPKLFDIGKYTTKGVFFGGSSEYITSHKYSINENGKLQITVQLGADITARCSFLVIF